MAGDFYPSDEPRPTPAERLAPTLAGAERWGEQRRAGVIRDPGCDSVAAMLDEQDRTGADHDG